MLRSGTGRHVYLCHFNIIIFRVIEGLETIVV